MHGGAQDLLVIRTPQGREALVPFVKALVPEVDLTPAGWSSPTARAWSTPLPGDDGA